MDILILAALVILIVLVVWSLLKRRSDDASTEVKASLKEDFLNFQTTIHQELNTTRSSVEGAKNIISDHAIKTISQIKDVGETLQKLTQQQEEAQQLGQSLKDLLQAPKLRGNYGEAILEEMLERVLPVGIWERQYSIDGGEKVDCVVKFRDVIVPIDAKFPREDYTRYLEAEAPEDKAGRWKEFENAVKRQVTSIETKYVKPEKGTSEFGLMFIPSEAIYYETIAETNHLGEPSSIFEYAQEHRVIPVSPNTFYAFLQIVILAIRNVDIIKKSRKLQEGLASLQTSFDLFYKKYEEIGKGIERAAEAYRVGDGHIDRHKRHLDTTLQLEVFQKESEAALSAGKEEHE